MTRIRALSFRLAAIAVVAAWGLVGTGNAHAQVYDWGAMAIVSGTMGVNANQICIGEGTRGDIGCPTYAPSVTTAGLEVSGTVSASRFVGDGSGLTGIAAAGTFASLTDVSYSAAGFNIFGPGSLTGAVNGVTYTTAFGINALNDSGNVGYFNSAFGSSALASNTTGRSNSAFGRGALRNNLSGIENVGLGLYSGFYNGTGSGMTAVGANALYKMSSANNTTAIGNRAGYGGAAQYTISNTTLIGAYAGYRLQDSQSNTLIGYNAGANITTGNGNIVIGTSLSPFSNTGDNQLNLGNVLFGDIGNGSTLQGKLGINVTSPTVALEVSGSVTFNTGIVQVSTAQVNPLNLVRSNGNAVLIKISNTDGLFYMGMDPNENFGIGPTPNMTNAAGLPYLTVARSYQIGLGVLNPSQTLHVSGTVITTSWTGINFSTASKVTPTAPLEVSGTVSATRFVGDGSGLTGVVAAANDNIISGSAYVKAQQDTGAVVSGTLSVSGTLQLANGPTDACTTANGGALKRVGNRFYFCRP